MHIFEHAHAEHRGIKHLRERTSAVRARDQSPVVSAAALVCGVTLTDVEF